MTIRVGMIGLAEAGNYGDDLITIAVAQSISTATRGTEIQLISHGNWLDWNDIATTLQCEFDIVRLTQSRDVPGSRHDRNLLANCDAVVFGGGGLLQTSHHSERPYQWLRFLPTARPLVPVIAVGLGIGPLSKRWMRRLGRMASPFNATYLRDDDSVAIARDDFGWPSNRCRDFIDHEFLKQLLGSAREGQVSEDHRILGVALRSWPGLDTERMAEHVSKIAVDERVNEVRFYVLEANEFSPDVEFTESVRRKVSVVRTSSRPYRAGELIEFTQDLAECTTAISMKLHSSAVWAAAQVPMYPVSYAPKTAAFFGVQFNGLEVFDSVVEPAVEDLTVPRAQVVLGDWVTTLGSGIAEKSTRATLGESRRLVDQTVTFVINVLGKIKRVASRHSKCAR